MYIYRAFVGLQCINIFTGFRAFPHFTFANLSEVLVDYTQKKSDDYDARVPVLLADWYYNMFKASGIVTGDREKLIWEWQTKEKGYKHSG